MNTVRNNQHGNVAVIVLAAILIALLGIIGWKFVNKEDTSSKDANSSQTSNDSADETDQDGTLPSGGSILQVNARNTNRKNDTSQVASSTAEYMSNNSGQVPTDFVSGELTGTASDFPAPVELGFYENLTLEIGEQPALSEDGIVLVTGAVCGPNGETASGTTSRQYAVQYMLEEVGGTFKPACIDG